MEAVQDRVRVGRTPAELRQAILDNLYYVQARIPELATTNDWYMAVAYAVRDRMMNDWIQAFGRARRTRTRIVSYLSAEFLIGPQLGSNLLNVHDIRRSGRELHSEISDRVSTSFSPTSPSPVSATVDWAVSRPATWSRWPRWTFPPSATAFATNSASLIRKSRTAGKWRRPTSGSASAIPGKCLAPEISHYVGTGGHTEQYHDEHGHFRVRWIPEHVVRGIANDIPVAGYLTDMTNFLRLWSSEAIESFDFQAFNKGDYYDAVHEKVASETISKVLYPNDEAGGRQDSAPAAAILFHFLLLAGHDSNPQAARRLAAQLSTRPMPFSSTIPIPPSPSPN